MPSPARRAFLTAGSTALLTALAGCSLLNDTRDQIPIQVRNESDAAHSFRVRVRRMDEALLNAETDIAAAESASFRFPNPDETRTVTVTARVDEDLETDKQVDIGSGSGTQFLTIVLQSDGELVIWRAVE